MEREEVEQTLSSISTKLNEMYGHKMMLETLYSDIYKQLEKLNLLDKYERELDNCENAMDYEQLSCEISNEEDELTEEVLSNL